MYGYNEPPKRKSLLITMGAVYNVKNCYICPMKIQHPHRWEFLVMVILSVVFFMLKLPYMELPYYWDELAVYAKGAWMMSEGPFSLMPSALHPETSRGHPLLSYLVFSIPFKFFNNDVTSVHAFVTVIGIALLWLVYVVGNGMFRRPVGLIAAVLLAAQPVFIAQSGLVLPEVLLSLCMLAAVYFFYKGHLIGYALAASAAMLVKETAIIMPLVVLIPTFLLFITKQTNRPSIASIIVAFTPWVVYGLFLLVQKSQHGWYFFPLHADSVVTGFSPIWKKFSDYIDFGFWKQGRYLFALFLVIGILQYVGRFSIPPQHRPALLYLIFLVLGMLGFSSINFYMDRYFLAAVVGITILVAFVMDNLLHSKPKVLAAITVIMMANALIYLSPKRFNYDVDMSYVNQVKILQEGVKVMEQANVGGQPVLSKYPIYSALDSWPNGYRTTNEQFNLSFEYSLLGNMGSPTWLLDIEPGGWDPTFPNTENLKLIEELKLKKVRFYVYRNF